MLRFLSVIGAMVFASAAAADMKVELQSPWDGKRVPKGQQCALYGGTPSTPPMLVTGAPSGAKMIVVQFNDRSYAPLSKNGGHGTIGWPVKGGKATLHPVPEGASKLSGGAVVVANNRGTLGNGKGYIAPCSGGRNNNYEAVVQAVDAGGKVLEKVRVKIGRY